MTIRADYAPRLMGREAAAFYLDISPRTLDALQAQGHLLPKKLGKGRKWDRKELDAYADSLDDWGEEAAS